MGREIRMVPPNYEHPRYNIDNAPYPSSVGKYMPQHDKTYAEARQEWIDGLAAWEAGKDTDREVFRNEDGSYQDYWEWRDPPDRDRYRAFSSEEATWFQLFQTVSEGTPVSPPFATKQELADYLAVNGDFSNQSYDEGGWGKERAERFVFGPGWSPSMIVRDGKVLTNPGDMVGA